MSSLLPNAMTGRFDLLSEAVLEMSPDDRVDLRLEAPFVVSPEGKLFRLDLSMEEKLNQAGPKLVSGHPRVVERWESIR
jgi:hypothetical protein